MMIEIPWPRTPKGSAINTENGWVTLGGSGDRWCEKDGPEKALKYLYQTVIHDSKNDAGRIKSREIRDKIEKALERGAPSCRSAVMVTIEGARVTLTGSVRSSTERYVAARLAWSTPDVSEVTNNLVVACQKEDAAGIKAGRE
jgi:osmotically-inducible protein OsmY